MLFSFDSFWKMIGLLLFFWGFYNFAGFELTVVTLLTLIWLKKPQT
tara:strand:+ start:23141 stop:23278 length:138 start_codon:yes stop_codon:yes gene_type:complete